MHEWRWYNCIEITQQTKLRVVLVVSSNVDTAKMHGLDTSNVSSRVKWNLGFSRTRQTLAFAAARHNTVEGW